MAGECQDCLGRGQFWLRGYFLAGLGGEDCLNCDFWDDGDGLRFLLGGLSESGFAGFWG